MSGVNGGNQDVDIDLSRIIAAVWERKVRIVGATVIAAAVALVGTSLMKPSYMGETRLLIESRSPNLSGGEAAAQANDPLLDSLNVTSQAQLLQSSDLIKRVVRDLSLSKLEEFDPAAQALLPDPLVIIGLKQDPMKLNAEDRVIEEFRDKLHVYPVENSRVIAIEFSSHDPKLAADIPNRMAEVYLEFQSGAKLDTHSETAKWLEPEIASLTQRVKDAEKKVADYRSSNGLFQTTETNSFSTQQLNDISAELARVRGERANAEARAENVRAALKAGRASDTLSDVVGSQVIQRLKEAEANLQAQISDTSTALLEGHPRLKGLRAQLTGIRQQIDSETRKILTSLENEAELSRIRERQLMSQLNGLKAESARAGEEEVGLRALEREAAAQRQLLETYLARYRQASSRLEGNSSPADARVVSRAVEPSEPYFPKIIPIVIVVSLVTFILGCLLVVITELFSGRALRPSAIRQADVEPKVEPQASAVHPTDIASKNAPVPVHDEVAAVPAPAVAEAEPVASTMNDEAISEDNSFTIDAVAHYLQRYAVPVAIAVSPSGDAGSTATVMLAREIAAQGRSVVLVDMTGSACPTRLMAENKKLPGITDLLCGETAFGDAIHPDRLSGAHVIPQGVSDPARAMRGADRLTMIIDALADAYDLVLIECGPAEVSGLSRLTRKDTAEVVLSVPGYKDEDVAALVVSYEEAGYPNLLVMSEPADKHLPRSGKRAA
jgi:exopolysaccharide transport family protein